jgi:hypothetical protein
LGFAAWVLGWDFLRGDVTVVRQVSGDNAAGLAAFRVYIAEGWGWPLLRSARFGASGVNVAFTDSIPILAVTAKLLQPLGIAAETWWSAWYGLVYGLQGMAAVFAVRSWGARSPSVQLAGAGLALLAPVLLYQSVHPSLSAHFVLLVAWGLAGRLTRHEPVTGSDRHWFSALAVIALGIHPYLAVMVVAMMLGVAIDVVATGRLPVARAAIWMGRTVGLMAAWLVAGGYLSTIGSSGGGYGIYATYVSGPFRPVISDLLRDDPFGPNLNPSHPGYSYLGLGVLVVAAAALVWNRQQLRGFVAANQGLVVALGLLAAWAVTPAIHLWSDDPINVAARLASVLGSDRAAGVAASVAGLVGGVTGLGLWWAARHRNRAPLALLLVLAAVAGLSAAGLVAPSIVDALTVQFRASGRFAWPALYGVPVLGLAGIDAAVRKHGATANPGARAVLVAAGMAAVVSLQYLDTGTLRQATHAILLPGGEARQLHVGYLTDLVAAHDQVRLAPDFRCTYFPEGVSEFVDVTHAASAAGKPIDRIYSARQTEPDQCVIPQQPDLSDPGTVWFLIEPVSLLDRAADPVKVQGRCRRRETINVCTHHWDDLSPEIGAYFGPIDD